MSAEAQLLLKTGFEVAKAAYKHYASADKKDRRLSEDLCRALRTIYFAPTGVITLLKEIARGDKVSPERLQQALVDFNDREWEVQAAAQSLDYERLGKELGVTIATANALNSLRHGKLSLRREIQNEINFYGQENAKPRKVEVEQLLQGIAKLNVEIEKLEELVNRRV
jgi:hypothetical protein